MKHFYPMLFEPVLKSYIWGGRNLEQFGRILPPGNVIAESWEIAGHADGDTVVANGPYTGRTLIEVHADLGLDLIGRRNTWAQEQDKFPLLIKLVDANQPLSVQVHPDDAYAQAHEVNELGKTEMWVVLRARPGAELILGVTAGTTRAAFREGLKIGQLEPFLHRLPVRAGDHVCVPAGTLHAIMDGLLLAEIQQNSNATYRVYDWNRVGADGRPRPLHVDKALDVIDFDQVEPQICPPALLAEGAGIRRWELCRNSCFIVERVELAAGAIFQGRCNGESLETWGVIAGRATINQVALDAIRFALLPAALDDFEVTAHEATTLLRAYAA